MLLASCLAAQLPASQVQALDSAAPKDIKREDLSSAPRMEVVSSISELKPRDLLALYFHHGIEAGMLLQGGMVEVPDKGTINLPTGAPKSAIIPSPMTWLTVPS